MAEIRALLCLPGRLARMYEETRPYPFFSDRGMDEPNGQKPCHLAKMRSSHWPAPYPLTISSKSQFSISHFMQSCVNSN